MNRNPDDCPSRVRLPGALRDQDARCRVVERVTGVPDLAESLVRRETCEACCRSVLRGEDLNPVVASLVYTAAGRILESGGAPGCSSLKAEQMRTRVMAHLAIVPPGLPDRILDRKSVV